MRIRVEGGHALNGIYQPAGSTNAALALLGASLLTEHPVTLNNIPRTVSVTFMRDLAHWLGADIQEINPRHWQIRTPQLTRRTLSAEQTQGFVGALLYLAPILIRRGYVRMEIDFPLHRIRTHLEALRDLNQNVTIADGAIEIRVAKWDYKDIILTQSSVTATAMVLMLATSLGQETVIHNAASEPHLQELAYFLELMGAQIEGIGSNVLRVWGTHELHGANATIGFDHIEAASIAAISAICGGRIEITGTARKDLRLIARIYQRLGIRLDLDETAVFVPNHEMLTAPNREEDVDSSIETAPWPGFPSDLVSIATVTATQTRGTTLIHEKLFNDRLLFVDKLNAMGAQIVLCDPHRAIVVGHTPLHAIYVDSPDVRIGLGMLGAALVAHGTTVIDNAQTIGRSFEGVLENCRHSAHRSAWSTHEDHQSPDSAGGDR